MRIEGMDAPIVNYNKVTEVTTTDKSSRDNTKESVNISHLTPNEKKELPISEKVMIDAIEKANKVLAGSNRHLEYSVHEKTKEIMVKVVDSDTKEVVKEFPPEKILDMIAKMWEMAGLIVDERR